MKTLIASRAMRNRLVEVRIDPKSLMDRQNLTVIVESLIVAMGIIAES